MSHIVLVYGSLLDVETRRWFEPMPVIRTGYLNGWELG